MSVHDLAELLRQIELHDTNYDVREQEVKAALSLAIKLGYTAGVRGDPSVGDEWPVFVIMLPDDIGEVAWHSPRCPDSYTLFPAYVGPEYDGYSTETKYARCKTYYQRYL